MRNFDDGSLLQILQSVIMQHSKLSLMGLQSGLSKATRSGNGRTVVAYYGFVAIVRFSCLFTLHKY